MRGMGTIYERPGTRLLWVKYYLLGSLTPSANRPRRRTTKKQKSSSSSGSRGARNAPRWGASRNCWMTYLSSTKPTDRSHLKTSAGRPFDTKSKGWRRSLPKQRSIVRWLSYERHFRDGAVATPPKVGYVQRFPMFTENNVRKGYLDRDGYAKMRKALPPELRSLFVVAYISNGTR